ncbi:LeuD/DmdB family oxidoreductase small subunit [Testudinibacter sp. TR-2022]|uniref:LeuD/DmdB family oxidoreductase small subunit n=1 Tax=Testudinibacter sp. TR-2022 TaxID=2585029 RepID=UPI00111901AA|nr:3-isopropylmalate dehydratase [Testudinibacter sp. TR-2022]TNH07245.1 3-isopropylmalate dehydratase [Pasteurellaceae bacterium Phil11]TNH21115.1 3-isopropylmalate dehydratase [Testudinibacter sp. TR-2022]TNH27790.1 3-isopropylmalate dehydratase [Testudinibacter sp. TR-2022]
MKFEGKAWVFGNNINTDIISPPQYMELSIEEAAVYSMQAVHETFAKQVAEGDIFIAADNLGSGSSRETSPLTLKYLGIKVVVAKSFARIFYRNCINLGIPAIECPDWDGISEGDQVSIDVEQGQLLNLTRNTCFKCSKLPDNIMQMIEAGGLVNYLKAIKGE